MAITLATAARNAACDAIVDLIDAGAGAGVLQIGSAGFAVILADITFNDPAFGAASGGTATAATSPSALQDTTTVAGTAAVFRVRDSKSVDVFSVTVGTSGTDIILNSTAFTLNGTVTLTSLTLTVPAS